MKIKTLIVTIISLIFISNTFADTDYDISYYFKQYQDADRHYKAAKEALSSSQTIVTILLYPHIILPEGITNALETLQSYLDRIDESIVAGNINIEDTNKSLIIIASILPLIGSIGGQLYENLITISKAFKNCKHSMDRMKYKYKRIYQRISILGQQIKGTKTSAIRRDIKNFTIYTSNYLKNLTTESFINVAQVVVYGEAVFQTLYKLKSIERREHGENSMFINTNDDDDECVGSLLFLAVSNIKTKTARVVLNYEE